MHKTSTTIAIIIIITQIQSQQLMVKVLPDCN